MGAADEEDEPGEEADDLQGLAVDEVERRLADSVKFPNDVSYVIDNGFFRYRSGRRPTLTMRIH
jgi:hypothetical protein